MAFGIDDAVFLGVSLISSIFGSKKKKKAALEAAKQEVTQYYLQNGYANTRLVLQSQKKNRDKLLAHLNAVYIEDVKAQAGGNMDAAAKRILNEGLGNIVSPKDTALYQKLRALVAAGYKPTTQTPSTGLFSIIEDLIKGILGIFGGNK